MANKTKKRRLLKETNYLPWTILLAFSLFFFGIAFYLVNILTVSQPLKQKTPAVFVFSEPKTSETTFQKTKLIPHQAKFPSISYKVVIKECLTQAEASQYRINLLLSGIEANQIAAQVNEKAIFQIYKGPYENLELAKAWQNKLSKKGYSSIIQRTTASN